MTYDELVSYAQKKHFEPMYLYKTNPYAAEKFEEEIETIKQDEKKLVNPKLIKEFIRNKRILPCVEYILKNGASQGNRNNLMVALTSSLLQSGKNNAEVLNIVLSWNELKNEPKLPEAEVRATVASAIRNFEFNKNYGCSSFKNLEVCLKDCPIHK